MKIWNEKEEKRGEEKRREKEKKGQQEREKCSREHTSSSCPLLTSHDGGVVESTHVGPQSSIIHLETKILNTEGEMQRKEKEEARS